MRALKLLFFTLGISLISHGQLQPSSISPGLKIPHDLQANIFASNPDVAHPTAFSIDEQGRFYVVETWRAGNNGNYGNRSHRYWLFDDNANQTSAERMAMLKKWQEKEDYTKHSNNSEIVKILTDSDNDGKVDSSTIFADGFNHPLDGIASGIYAGLGKIYFSCIPNIWDLTDSNNDGVAEKREVLYEGFGVHYSFWGHDLNGFKLGPDFR